MKQTTELAIRRKHSGLFFLTLCILSFAILVAVNRVWRSATIELAPSALDGAVKAYIHQAYGNLPLSFETNRGQAREPVKFLSRGPGYTLYLTPTEAVLTWPEAERGQVNDEKEATPSSSILHPSSLTEVRLKLVGASQQAHISGLDELPGKSHYFLGQDPKQWLTNIPTYCKVKYEAVYPGIDLIYYGRQQQLEFDFLIAPGADPKVIKLSFAGVESLRLDEEGDLILETKAGKLRQHRPIVYQMVAGIRREIAGSYVQTGRNEAGFEIGEYDTSRPLVIDPVLSYATFLGGSGRDSGQAIAVDAAGNAFVTGLASSTFPTTPGALQPGDTPSVFVTKLNATGTALIYSAVIGGSDYDKGYGIAVDGAGNAYVTGVTRSGDFPTTTGAFQTQRGGGISDAFVAKLNPAGNTLIYSTYLGGAPAALGLDGLASFGLEGEAGLSVAVNTGGYVYVTGVTNSDQFPTTSGAFQTSFGGYLDAFVTELAADGSQLVYSTYLGGGGLDYAAGLAVDIAGQVYLSGLTTFSCAPPFLTRVTPFPTTPGAFQTDDGGVCSFFAFVTKLGAAGSSLLYSTLLGQRESWGTAIAVDTSGHAYVTGFANPAFYPTTPGAFQITVPEAGCFVTKLNPTGTALIYSTLLRGGTSFGIVVDGLGQAHVTGAANAAIFPVTQGPQDAEESGAFVAKFNAEGSALVYSLFLRGGVGYGIALDAAGAAYVTGEAGEGFSTLITPGAFQSRINSDGSSHSDAFVAKVSESPLPPTSTPTPTPTPAITAYYNISGRLTDRSGKGLPNMEVALEDTGRRVTFTDRSGYYRFSTLPGGSTYKVIAQPQGPTVHFTTYYPNPGYVIFRNLSRDEVANFTYNLTSPWVPPDATPTPTPTPVPTPKPSPAPQADGEVLNPGFEQGGLHWISSGLVSFDRGVARLTPSSFYSPASVLQWVQLTPGATYELSAEISTDGRAAVSLGVKWEDYSDGPAQPDSKFGSQSEVRRVRFIVPHGMPQVGIYCKATGSATNRNWATVDNFRLTRLN